MLDRLNVFVCVVRYVGFTGHIPTQDAICVFDHAALPGAVRVAVPDIHTELVFHRRVVTKLTAAIERNGWECPIFCVTAFCSMLPERSKDDDDFQGTTG